jgi:5,10-methylenetetrahydromethanopterin reductase
MTQFWTVGVSAPRSIGRYAAKLEADGFDGVAVVDSQNLSGDPYVALAMAAVNTSTLGLATGVTNPYTRHPAATASSIASVQSLSNGRAVLGIGRGDSALAHLGLSPAPVSVFARYLRRLQGYLRGDDVPFDEGADSSAIASVDALGLGDQPAASRIQWINAFPKVPLDVAATGPQVIELAAVVADQVTFAVGADTERLTWAIELARAARREAELDPDQLGIGAYVNVAVHPDLEVARRLTVGGLSTLARFNVMHGRPVGPYDEGSAAMLTELHHRYDMNHHTQGGSVQAATLTPEFVDRYAVVGSVDTVRSRLSELMALGIGRFVLMGVGRAPGLEGESEVAYRNLVDEVMPALRS